MEGTVAALRRTFASGRTRDLSWRIAQLRGLESLLTEHESELAEALDADLGRPAHYSWFGDLASTRVEAVYARKHLRRWARTRRTALPLAQLPGAGSYRYEPRGVVLVIGPWNYPLYLTLGPLIGALAAGNCAVLKPSEHAPATAALLAELLPVHLDPEAVAVIEGEAEVTQHLLAQGMDHAFFTGGPEVGKLVMAAAARTLTPVTLELGGKCPVIVTADARLDIAARRIAWTKMLNSGQTCIAPDYVLVEDAVRDELAERIAAAVREFQRAEAAPSGQRVVNTRQFERITGLLDGSGGRVLVGGSADPATLHVDTTVIVDPDPGSDLMTGEIFGPVLPVLGVPSLRAALDFVNDRPKPLALYLFTSSSGTRRRVVAGTSSGAVVVNHIAMHCLAPQLPFGGVGASGMGSYHGRWGFETFSHRKAVLTKTARPDPRLLYPPYSARKLKALRRIF
ncbi:aldehyde dehydrogenase family protein [Streptomyces albus]|nr:aldehyde dehydrogenase family protein [Streptomyces albus]